MHAIESLELDTLISALEVLTAHMISAPCPGDLLETVASECSKMPTMMQPPVPYVCSASVGKQ